MGGHFTIDVDHQRQLLRVRMSGFFSLDEVARYRAAIDAATGELAVPAARQRMLCDISDMKIQSQDVVAAFERGMAHPAYCARPIGFIAASTLARAQLNRILGARRARIFASTAEAEHWLFAGDAATSSAA